MKRLIIIVLMLANCSLAAQSIQRIYGTTCVGDPQAFALAGCISCSQVEWSVSGQHTSYTVSGDRLTIGSFYWASSGQVHVSANYFNNITGQSGSANFTDVINDRKALSVAANVTQDKVCEGTTIEIKATPSTTQGLHTYYYYIRQGVEPPQLIATAGSPTLQYPANNLLTGTYQAYVDLTITGYGCLINTTATSKQTPATFTIVPKSSFSVDIHGPGSICSSQSEIQLYATTSGTSGNVTFTWFSNGALAGSGNPLVAPVVAGRAYVVKATSDSWCSREESSEPYVINFIPTQSPTASIQITKNDFCPGETIQMTAQSPQANAGSTYLWLLNGVEFSRASTASLVASELQENGTFYNGSVVTVTIRNLSGVCLSSDEAIGTTANSPVVVHRLPDAFAPETSICSGTSFRIEITNPNTISNTNYHWRVVSRQNTIGGTSGDGASISDILHNDNNLETGFVRYEITPSAAGCPGHPFQFNVYVKPKVKILNSDSELNPPGICSGSLAAFTPKFSISDASAYWWPVEISDGIDPETVSSSGIGSINDTIQNRGNSTGLVRYLIMPAFQNCMGDPVMLNIQIKPIADMKISPSVATICSGEELNFVVSTRNNTEMPDIQWIGSLNNAEGQTSGRGNEIRENYRVKTPGSNGTATFTVFANLEGCNSHPVIAIAEILDAPTSTPEVTGNKRFGPGPLLLNASSNTAADIFLWYDSLGNQISRGPHLLTPNIDRSYIKAYFVVTNNGTCNSTRVQVDLIVYPLPTVKPCSARVYLGKGAQLETETYDSYEWKLNERKISSEKSILVRRPGWYTVTVTREGTIGHSIPCKVKSQFEDLDANYIVTRQVNTYGIAENADTNFLSIDSATQQVEYFDGIGRPFQMVHTMNSPNMNDLVQPTAYDQFGRVTVSVLPFSYQQNGWYKSDILEKSGLPGSLIREFYNNPNDDIADDAKPYAQTKYEAVPGGRPVAIGAPGEVWQPTAGHAKKKIYNTNTAADSILVFQYNPSNKDIRVVKAGRYYSENELTVTTLIDEEGNDVAEFHNKSQQLICRKVNAGSAGFAITYYVYDSRGNIVFVMPPEATKQFLSDLR